MSKAETDPMMVDRTLVRELAELLNDTNLSEIEVADGERRIRVVRQISAAITTYAPPVMAPQAVASAPIVSTITPAEDIGLANAVTSPMVGMVYLSGEPGKPAFISPGTQVKEGDTLLIIEAMKVMNPIPAPRSGTVKAILVANEHPVEYGEPLVIIE